MNRVLIINFLNVKERFVFYELMFFFIVYSDASVMLFASG